MRRQRVQIPTRSTKEIPVTGAAAYMAAALHKVGVKRVYGIVGDSLNGFTDALRMQGTIEWTRMRHEEGAAFAAAGEGHVTGKRAVRGDRPRESQSHALNSP